MIETTKRLINAETGKVGSDTNPTVSILKENSFNSLDCILR